MTVPETLGVALLSFFRHQDFYAPFFAQHPRARLVVACDEPDISPRLRDLNQTSAAKLGIPYVEDIDAVLARDDVDLVSVCTEHVRHARLGVAVLRAGKHLMLDKPVAMSLAEVAALEQAAAAARGAVAVTYALRHEMPVRQIRQQIAAGAIGYPYMVHVDSVGGVAEPPQPPSSDFRWGQFTERDPEGGEFFNLGSHLPDLITYLTGCRVLSVFALGPSAMATYQQRGVESLAVASMTLERGITATFLSGRGAGFRGYIQYVRVLGARGTVFADINRPEIYLDRGGVRTAMQVGEDGYANLIDGVIAAALDGQPSPAPLSGGLDAVRVILAAQRSLETGQVVRLD